MATIQKRTNKDGAISYRATIRIKGFPIQTATFTDEELCKQWAQQTESAIRDSIHLPELRREKNTLANIIERYKKEHLPKLSSDEARRREIQLRFWKEKLGMHLVNEITPAMIKEIMDELSKTITILHKKPISPATLTRRLAALSHVFTICCVEWDLITTSPTQYVQRAEGNRARLNTRVMLKSNEIIRILTNAKVSPQIIDKIKEMLE